MKVLSTASSARASAWATALAAMSLGSAASADFTLSAEGDCPGLVTLSWDGAPPDSAGILVVGREPGSFTIPAVGPCAGVRMDLQRVLWIEIFRSTGPEGRGEVVVDVRRLVVCGSYLQMLAFDGPCLKSNVAQIPE